MQLGKVQVGQRVLVHGAAGGVGNLAVQFAKAKGAYVIGTASPYNFNFLKELGLDEAIDYKNQDFENLLGTVDLVFNASPVRDNHTRLKSVELLKEGGIFVCTQLDAPLNEELKDALIQKNATGTLVGGGGMGYVSSLNGTTKML